MAETLSAGERAADRLLAIRIELAAAVTSALYADMPHLGEKYGERGRARCLEDMLFNIEHLAPAVALGEPQMFAGYVRWLDDLLRARNVDTAEVVRSLQLMNDLLGLRLDADEAAAAAACVSAGLQVLEAA